MSLSNLNSINGNNLSHAYIVCGPEGSDKPAFANRLASAMVCSGDGDRPCGVCRHCLKAERGIHPDIITVGRAPDKKEITVDQIRTLKSDSVFVPNEAARKVYIIQDAGTMNTAAQNAMLKLLEEPPRHAAFILVADNPAELLPTVRSRCAEIDVEPTPGGDGEEIPELAEEMFEVMSKGNAIKTTEFFFSLDGIEAVEMKRFTAGAKKLAVAKLKEIYSGGGNGFSPASLLHMIDVLDQADRYLEVNVGTVHIISLLSAELIDTK